MEPISYTDSSLNSPLNFDLQIRFDVQMATNHCLLNGGDDLWEGGPSEDLALAVKGVKPIGTESVPSRFAAERQKCLWQRAHILKAKNLPALECICMAAMCTTAPAFLAQVVQGPILWRPSGTWWNQWWNPIDVQLKTYGEIFCNIHFISG